MLTSKSINLITRRRAILLCVCAALLGLIGQAQVLDDMIYTVGTTTQDAAHRNWAYVLWQGTTPGLIQNKHFAVYAKPGDGAAANPFVRQTVVGVQTEPAVIKVILNRSINLGDDLEALNTRINNLFQKILPPTTLPLEEKISIVIRGSLNDPNHFNNLIMLAHLHPSISISLGMAHAAILDPGLTTFEVREFDLPNNRDIGVVGRVTVQAGVVIPLPAPGAPVAVPDPSAKGNLNVELRWATPDDLRRLSLLNYGFNVYRITRAFAEAQGFNVTPPTAANLFVLAGSNSNVVQLNHMPVLKNKDFTLASATDLVADPKTTFFADDNRRYEPGGVAFNNGDKFYYFVVARDVLGRIGKVSPGTLVTICDRLPPNSPTGVAVLNDYNYIGGVSKQVLKVRWKQDPGTNDSVKAYYVYRWAGPDDVQRFAGNPLSHRIAGPIPHLIGQEFASYVDDGSGSPTMPADAGKTFWYTIRSEDNSACGGNLSANSGPVFGVLRDRIGPDAPGGYVQIMCRRPIVEAGRQATITTQDKQDESLAYFQLMCDRRDAGIAWAEFYALDTSTPSNYLGRIIFKEKDALVTMPYVISRAALANMREIPFYCRVASTDGRISSIATQIAVGAPNYGTIKQVFFDAYTTAETVRATGFTANGRSPCFRHDPNGPSGSGDGTTKPTVIVVILTPGTKEFKVYRRVDYGPLTLIKQGPSDYASVTEVPVPDDAMPPNAGTICYYAQLFDEHGNPSPLTLIGGDCIVVKGTSPLPAPMLAKLETTGVEASPRLNVKWFCPPYGIDRFLVHVSVNNGSLPASISDQLSDYVSATPDPEIYTLQGASHTNDFFTYRTPHVGPGFGNGAQFEVELHVVQGKTYTVFITAVGKDSSVGPRSNVEQGTWTPAIETGPQVPWPARPLPPLNLFSSSLIAERLPAGVFDGTGVRIGVSFDRATQGQDKGQPIIFGAKDPMSYLYTNSVGEKLFPAAMYRVQLANTAFPKVSGDVVQVAPLMENIAYNIETINATTYTAIKDPFIKIGPAPAGTAFVGYPIYLVDTQPVLANARYVYLFVRFDENHEIKEVVPSSAVDVLP